MEFLKHGFLRTRGDFMSDLLILALLIILPVLFYAVQSGRLRNLKSHHNLMLVIYYTLVAYVLLYEGNMLSQGGMEYLRTKIRMEEIAYFAITGFHVLLGAVTLVLGAITIRRGRAIFFNQIDSENKPRHKKLGWFTVYLLIVTSVTGIIVYYFTFIFEKSGV